ncbi:MAG TPA: outer membrane beta-barrel protein [Gemmatimonadaceae bacterium]|jgi:hypothetical protein|nr:outer membrane beta-barrel protein [Gemmatimonadaceae bacterium]
MRTITLAIAVLVVCAAPLAAQEPGFFLGPRYGVSVYGGYMQLDNLFRGTNGASYSNTNAAQVGAQAGVSLNPVITLLGNVTYVKTSAQFALSDSLAPFASPNIGIWLLDGNVQLSAPFGYPIMPFVQVGVGAAWYRLRLGGTHHGNADVEFNAAVGAHVPLTDVLRLVVMAKDYVISFHWAAVGDPQFDDHVTGNTTTNIGVSIGLELGY